jgi:hypothetical protein
MVDKKQRSDNMKKRFLVFGIALIGTLIGLALIGAVDAASFGAGIFLD